MGVPFGFSVGDLITGIGAMKMAIGAFSDTSGATNEYEQLLSTLNILSRSLDALNRIPVHPTHETEQRTAITQAVQNCQQCVNVFLLRITKYDLLKQPDMPRLWLEKFKVAIRKVQWVLCEKSEIARFRHEVQQQVDTINLLMATFHVSRTESEATLQRADRQEETQRHQTVLESHLVAQNTYITTQRSQEILCDQETTLVNLQAGQNQLLRKVEEQVLKTSGLLNGLQEIMAGSSVSRSQAQAIYQFMVDGQARSEKLQEEREEKLFHQLNELSKQIGSIGVPPQVLLRQPVTLLDALGQRAPVHLDFIDSAEAFIAVLKIRFKKVGSLKITKNEFRISDPHKNRVLDLRKPWDSLVKPGQHIHMSMVFAQVEEARHICPNCRSREHVVDGPETVCTNCIITYDRQWVDVEADTLPFPYYCKPKERGKNPQIANLKIGKDMIRDFSRVHIISVYHSWTATRVESQKCQIQSQEITTIRYIWNG